MNPISSIHLQSSPESKFILFSDAHRGDGSGADDFSANSQLFKCALDHYFDEGYTLIELGDSEELLENEQFDQIYISHAAIYDRLARFHQSGGRYIKLWGNHDDIWGRRQHLLQHLFPGIVVYEAAVIDRHLLLWHGHRADPKCQGSWAEWTRVVLRKFWYGMQQLGFRDPTRAAENPGRCDAVDKVLFEWAKTGRSEMGRLDEWFPGARIDTIIAGHTHRPVFQNLSLTDKWYAEKGRSTPGTRRGNRRDSAYFNTGSCVHPRCITGIELMGTGDEMHISLIKWSAEPIRETESVKGAVYPVVIQRTVLESALLKSGAMTI